MQSHLDKLKAQRGRWLLLVLRTKEMLSLEVLRGGL